MAKRETTISASVTETERKQWKEAAEEYGSLSRMIRLAVTQLLNDETTEANDNNPSPKVENKIDTLIEHSQAIDRSMNDLQNETRLIHQEVRETPEDTKKLAGDIFDILPRETELLGPNTKPIDGGEAPVWTGDYIRTGNPEDIAEWIDAPLIQVKDALLTLEEDHHMVQSMIVDGEEGYFKDV